MTSYNTGASETWSETTDTLPSQDEVLQEPVIVRKGLKHVLQSSQTSPFDTIEDGQQVAEPIVENNQDTPLQPTNDESPSVFGEVHQPTGPTPLPSIFSYHSFQLEALPHSEDSLSQIPPLTGYELHSRPSYPDLNLAETHVTLDEPPPSTRFMSDASIEGLPAALPAGLDVMIKPVTKEVLAEMNDLKGWKIELNDDALKVAEEMQLDRRYIELMEKLFNDFDLVFKVLAQCPKNAEEARDIFVNWCLINPELRDLFIDLNVQTKAFLYDAASMYWKAGGIGLKLFLRKPGKLKNTSPKSIIYQHKKNEGYKALNRYYHHHLTDKRRVHRMYFEAENNARIAGKRLAWGIETLPGKDKDGPQYPAALRMYYVNSEKNFHQELIDKNIIEKLVGSKNLAFFAYYGYHQYGIVHRDIKPDNVPISLDDGCPYIVDPGEARPEVRPEIFTNIRQMIGTPAYMSPEQMKDDIFEAAKPLSGQHIHYLRSMGYKVRPPLTKEELEKISVSDPKECSPRLDVYAIGLMMYEIFAGQLPFPASRNTKDLLLNRLRVYPPDPGFPPKLKAIIFKAIDIFPENRYAHAGELLAALEGLTKEGLQSVNLHET